MLLSLTNNDSMKNTKHIVEMYVILIRFLPVGKETANNKHMELALGYIDQFSLLHINYPDNSNIIDTLKGD